MHTKYINCLIHLLEKSKESNAKPYAALIVYNGQIISEAINETHLTNDPTAHAELIAIQRAVQVITQEELKQAILYASGEPCLMCQTAAAYAQLQEVYYVCSKEEMLLFQRTNIQIKPIVPKKLDAQQLLQKFI